MLSLSTFDSIVPNKRGDMCFEFKNLKEIKAAVMEVKRLPQLQKIFDEPVPKAFPYAHPNSEVYHTLTGDAQEFIWAVFHAFTPGTHEEPFKVQLYTYHGVPLHWTDRKIHGFPSLAELKKKNFQF